MKRTRAALAVALSLSLTPVQAAPKRPTTRSEAVPSDDKLTLATPGVKGPIAYEKFGTFEGVGTRNYRYIITDKKGLAAAAGEGIFPNSDVQRDPTYKELQKQGKLAGNQWKFVDTNAA